MGASQARSGAPTHPAQAVTQGAQGAAEGGFFVGRDEEGAVVEAAHQFAGGGVVQDGFGNGGGTDPDDEGLGLNFQCTAVFFDAPEQIVDGGGQGTAAALGEKGARQIEIRRRLQQRQQLWHRKLIAAVDGLADLRQLGVMRGGEGGVRQQRDAPVGRDRKKRGVHWPRGYVAHRPGQRERRPRG